MTKTPFASIKTLGELKKAGYISLNIKDEMRKNLICAMKNGKNLF